MLPNLNSLIHVVTFWYLLQGNEPEVKIEVLMERMKKLNEDEDEEPTEEERMKRFETIENQSAECMCWLIY